MKRALRILASLLLGASFLFFSCTPEIIPDDPSREEPSKDPDDEPEDDPGDDPGDDPAPQAEVYALWDARSNDYPLWADTQTIKSKDGQGTIRYVLSSQTSVSRSAFKTDIANGNPRVTSAWAGDYWQFSSPVKPNVGNSMELEFRMRVSSGGMRYWRLEYLDGGDWLPAAPLIVKELPDGSKISYTSDFYRSGSADSFDKIVHSKATYTHPSDSVVFRLICVSNMQCSGTVLTSPSTSASARLSCPDGEPLQPCLKTCKDLEGHQSSCTVCGYVMADGSPVADVVVSDGFEVVTTDASGWYEMNSSKQHGYVFMSTPSGYEAPVKGIFAQSFKHLKAASDVCERVDFELKAVNQDKCRLYFLGDIHLANNTTTRDAEQFAAWGKDITENLNAYSSPKYLITLGDMTWDAYWYSKTYYYPDYIAAMDAAIPDGVPVFHTIGNHDHDMDAVGDWYTVLQYKQLMGPTYYSFNVGKVHVMVFDDIECTNPTADRSTTSYRSYNKKVVPAQLAWAKKDLQHVSKDTPIFVTGHAPLYALAGSDPAVYKAALDNTSEIVNTFAGYKVHYVTGHTHVVKNVDNLSASASHFEHNAGAVCAAWWRCYYWSGIHLETDGVPGGYKIFDLDGKDFKWIYKATGRSTDERFSSYDLGQIDLSQSKAIPNCTNSTYITNWNTYTAYSASHAVNFQTTNPNKVLINVWDYDPSWKVSVIEKSSSGSKTLTATRIRSYDPLYMAACVAMAYNKNSSITSTPTSSNSMFLVTASGPDTTLEITVTDRFGRTSKETMTRPKPFSIEAYK